MMPEHTTKFTSLSTLQQTLMSRGVAFASWCLPGKAFPETIIGDGNFLSFFEIGEVLKQGAGFVMAPFYPNQPILFIPQRHHFYGFDFEPVSLQFEETAYEKPSGSQPVAAKEIYLSQLEAIIQKIKSGKAAKVVLSRVIEVPLPSTFPADVAFREMCRLYPQAFVSMVFLPGKGLWMGASPELLFKSAGRSFQTMALAGTRPLNIQGDWGNKELIEHQWVSRYISKTIEKHGGTNIGQSPPFTVEAGKIAHLQTDFSASLPDGSSGRFLSALHPTPAVCGWPKSNAIRMIADTELHNRSFYTGYLGPIGNDECEQFYVNLRCMQINDNQAYIYVGGGITAASVPVDEWEETQMKSETMLALIKKMQNLAC